MSNQPIKTQTRYCPIVKIPVPIMDCAQIRCRYFHADAPATKCHYHRDKLRSKGGER